MNYEEKYKEALERAKKLYEQGTITESLGHVFPELKESEDERTRKEIIAYLDVQEVLAQGKDGDFKEWIAWLEKQDEKSTDEMIKALRTEYEKGRADAITEMQGEQEPAWSKYDELMLESCIDKMSMTAPNLWKKEIYWLKSIKSQKHWKPSEEQMKALEKECFAHSNYQLCRLLEELKKL